MAQAKTSTWREVDPWIRQCVICGWISNKGDRGVGHRAHHAQYVRVYLPKPDARLVGDVLVNSQSPYWLNRMVYEIAAAFRRENGYDFVQWHFPMSKPFDYHWQKWRARKNKDHDYHYYHAWLLVEELIPVGVVTFDWLKWPNIRHGWHLGFVWIAPPYRRQGVLTRRWPAFIQRYGHFTVENPLSDEMIAFLWKVHHSTELRQREAPEHLGLLTDGTSEDNRATA